MEKIGDGFGQFEEMELEEGIVYYSFCYYLLITFLI